MDTNDIKSIAKAYAKNYELAKGCVAHSEHCAYIAAIATMKDMMQGSIADHDSSPSCTYLCRRPDSAELLVALQGLGALGIQDMNEVQDLELSPDGKVLVLVNGRKADTGWDAHDPRTAILKAELYGRRKEFGEN